MSKASQYDLRYQAKYQRRADRLLKRDLSKDGFFLGWRKYGPLERDGDWFRLGQVYEVGAKFLRWTVDAGLLERRGSGLSYAAFKEDWYRFPVPLDLGDLWVPD